LNTLKAPNTLSSLTPEAIKRDCDVSGLYQHKKDSVGYMTW
jgi:hypothetical protein